MHKPIQYLLTVFVLLFTHNTFAQGVFYEWHKMLGGQGIDHGSSVVVDNFGDIYIIGEFEETLDLDPSEGVNNVVSNGFTDVYLKKMDAEGNFLWSYAFGSTLDDSAVSVVTHSSGGIYIW